MPIQTYMDAVLNNPYFSKEERQAYRGDLTTKKALYEKGGVIHFPVGGGRLFISAFKLNYYEGPKKRGDVTEHFFIVTDCSSVDSDRENQRIKQSCHLIFPPVPDHLPDFLTHLSSQKVYDEQAIITCLEHGYPVQDAEKELEPPIMIYDNSDGVIRIQREEEVNWFTSRNPEYLPRPPYLDLKIALHPFERSFLSTLHINQWVKLLQEKIDRERDGVFAEGKVYRDIELTISQKQVGLLQEVFLEYERIAQQSNIAALADKMSPQDLHWIHSAKACESYEHRHHPVDSSEVDVLKERNRARPA